MPAGTSGLEITRPMAPAPKAIALPAVADMLPNCFLSKVFLSTWKASLLARSFISFTVSSALSLKASKAFLTCRMSLPAHILCCKLSYFIPYFQKRI
jgi:hypothetical protein